jgi:hypothetical protein
MQTPDDVPDLEIVDLEEEANARGYFAEDEDDAGDPPSRTGFGSPPALLPVRSGRH